MPGIVLLRHGPNIKETAMAKKNAEADNKEEFNIDEALNKLEEINNRLSESDISLDDSIRLYNEGTVLATKCKEHLQGVEQTLKIVNV